MSWIEKAAAIDASKMSDDVEQIPLRARISAPFGAPLGWGQGGARLNSHRGNNEVEEEVGAEGGGEVGAEGGGDTTAIIPSTDDAVVINGGVKNNKGEVKGVGEEKGGSSIGGWSDLDAKLFIETHVAGVIQPIDLANIPAMEAKELEEHYDAEAMRRIGYIEFLCSKKTVLANLLHGTKYASMFAGMWQRFSSDRLSNIRRSDHPYNSGDSTSLVRFCRSYRPPAHGKPGRLYCANSLQGVVRPVRNRLIEDVCEDFDQQCAAGTGSYYIARYIRAPCNCLRALVSDPTAWKASMQDAGFPKRAVKDVLNTIWACDPRCQKMIAMARKYGKRFSDFLHLFNELQEIKISAFSHPDFQWALPHVKDGDNRIGRFFSLVLTAIEAVCTNTVVNFAVRHFEWKIMTIVHDGFNPRIKLNQEQQAFYCRIFGAICEALFPGLNLKWCVKPFDFMMYDKNGYELREFTIPPYWQPPENGVDDPEDVEEDEEFEGDPEGRSDFFPSYELVKAAHEQEFFKVEAVFVDLLTHAGDFNQGLMVRPKAWMQEKFQNKMYSKRVARRDGRNVMRDKYGKVMTERVDVEFLRRWLKDPHMRQFTSFRMQPGEPEEIVRGKRRDYNMWTPYYVESIDPQSVDFDKGRQICIRYIDFVDKLLGEDTPQTMMLLDFQAHPFVHPHLKPKVMACLLGAQGAGKTNVPKVSENMMGERHCCSTTLPERLVGNGNWASANKKQVVINEVPPDRVKKVMNDLKPLVTDSPLECKSMGKDPTWVPSVVALWLTSNFLTALAHAVNEKERRYWLTYCTSYWEEYANRFPTEQTHKWWRQLTADLACDDFLYVFWEFCKRRAYRVPEQWQKNGIPDSEINRVSKSSCKDWLHEFLEQMCEEWNLEVAVPIESISYEVSVCINACPEERKNDLKDEYDRLKNVTKTIYKEGIVQFSNKFLQERLDEFVRGKGWQEHKGMQSLGDKLGFFAIAHKGACRQIQGVPQISEDGNVRYGRGWEFDLDVLRRSLKLDVETVRRMRILSRHKNKACMYLEEAAKELKRCDGDTQSTLSAETSELSIKGSAQSRAQKRMDEIQGWLAFLDGRIALLNKPKQTTERSVFDAEQHFDEVWNHDTIAAVEAARSEAATRNQAVVSGVSSRRSNPGLEPLDAERCAIAPCAARAAGTNEHLDKPPDADQARSEESPPKLETKTSSNSTILDTALPTRQTRSQKRMAGSFTSDGQLTAERQQYLMEQASKKKRRR